MVVSRFLFSGLPVFIREEFQNSHDLHRQNFEKFSKLVLEKIQIGKMNAYVNLNDVNLNEDSLRGAIVVILPLKTVHVSSVNGKIVPVSEVVVPFFEPTKSVGRVSPSKY